MTLRVTHGKHVLRRTNFRQSPQNPKQREYIFNTETKLIQIFHVSGCLSGIVAPILCFESGVNLHPSKIGSSNLSKHPKAKIIAFLWPTKETTAGQKVEKGNKMRSQKAAAKANFLKEAALAAKVRTMPRSTGWP